MALSIVSFVGGLVILTIAAEALVRGSVALAARLGISPLVIGLTVIAFGTSAPELVVCVKAVLDGAPGIAWGNVVGSNIANLLLILGAAALLKPLLCAGDGVVRNVVLMSAATVLLAVVMASGVMVWWQGVVFLALLAGYLLYTFWRERANPASTESDDRAEEVEDMAGGLRARPMAFLVVMIVAGLIGLAVGAELLVSGAVDVARALGVSETVIGLTMVAVGTSLPELAAAVAAARHGHVALTVGNVVGSNLFNVLGVMGGTALVGAVPVPDQLLRLDVWVMLAATAALLPFVLRRAPLGRGVAVVFLAVYGGYVLLQFLGGEGLA